MKSKLWLPSNQTRLDNIVERLQAVQAFAALPESEALAAANKRITNILKKAEGYARRSPASPVAGSCRAGIGQGHGRCQTGSGCGICQRRLHQCLENPGCPACAAVDSFFNDVMVNAEDLALRNNRLALLASLHGMMNQVADISKLAA